MRVLILGAAGVLGSALTGKFLGMGLKVRAMDVCRIGEAWRLSSSRDRVDYLWKASSDIVRSDLGGVDVVMDAGIGVADRPLGNSSPAYTSMSNIQPSLRLLEAVRQLPERKRPTLIYPSSFNALYGHPSGATLSPGMLPNPSSVYGWTKASAELLYSTYHKAYAIPTVICRVGSGYGPKMRSDELPARLILDILGNARIRLRSPRSRRLWTYVDDIVTFYERLLNEVGDHVGETIHCAGNAGDVIVTNLQLARMIGRVAGRRVRVVEEGYEAGEMVDGSPVSFGVGGRSPLWRPRFSLEEGLSRTFSWFRENLWRYQDARS